MRKIKLARIQKGGGKKKPKRRIYAGHLDEFSLVDSPAVGEKVLVAKRASGTNTEGGEEMSDKKDVKKDVGEETTEDTNVSNEEAAPEASGGDDKIDRLIEVVTKQTEAVTKLADAVASSSTPKDEDVSKSESEDASEADTKKDEAPAAGGSPESGADVAVFVSTVTKAIDEKLGPVAKTLEDLGKRVDDIEETRPAATGADSEEETEQVEKNTTGFWGGIVTGVRG